MQVSLNQTSFSFASHVAWLNGALRDPARKIWIFELAGEPVAMGRADLEGDSYTLSWVVDSKSRGRGIGSYVVQALVANFRPAVAKIKSDNVASIRAAEKAGLRLASESTGVKLFASFSSPEQ